MVGGYLFTNAGGSTLYWGGGGTDCKYVYSKTAGNPWACLSRNIGNDEYGRAIPAAVPSGYRYNHIVAFKGSYYDYYGTYDANLGFTPYAATSPHTEPWGWFLMGSDNNSLYRVAHNKKGDRNYIFTNPGGTGWAQMAGSDNPAGGGTVYWRGCAAISNNANTKHNGLYATYSKDSGGGVFESGVYRFSNPSGGAGGPVWARCISTADARVYTGGIYIKKDEAIFVGTSYGVVRRGIGARTDVPGPPHIIVNPDPDEPQP